METSLDEAGHRNVEHGPGAVASPPPSGGRSWNSSSSLTSFTSRAVPFQLPKYSGSQFSETSSDDSDENYKEKYEHLQILLKQLHKQINSEKIRKEGVDTISRCLQEERESNKKLRSENKQYQTIIKTLQTRLANNGLPISVEEGSSEDLPGGIVKQDTFDSLVRENISLQSQLKYLSVDPARMEDALKQNNLLREKILSLQQEVLQLRGENQEVTRILGGSADDKLTEINKLRLQLHDLRAKGQTKDVLCQSLSEQSQALQERLKETGDMCQQLLRRLEQAEGKTPSSQQQHQEQQQQTGLGASFNQMNLSAEGAASQGENTALQKKINDLRTQLKEVIDVNQKWQAYHEKREADFQTLRAKLQTTEDRLAHTPTSLQLSEQQQEQIDKLVLQYKRQIEDVEEEKAKILDENRELRLKLSQAESQKQTSQDQVNQLLSQLRTQSPGGSPSHSPGGSREDQERIQALEMQVKVCTEDFECERRDRERANDRIVDLEREINVYKTQLESMQRAARRGTQTRRNYGPLLQCDTAEVNLDDVPMPEPSGPPQLMGRGIYQSDNMEEDEGEDTVDLPLDSPVDLTQKTSQQQPDLTQITIPKEPIPLQCPQCHKEFSRENHMDLLKHMNGCLQ